MSSIVWIIIALEALVIVAVVFQILRKRIMNRQNDDELDAETEQVRKGAGPIVDLPEEERWD